MTKRWVLGLLLGCTTPAIAQTQAAALPSQTDGTVVVEFRPPVGKQLHYQVTTSGKAGAQRISLRFERSGDGYLMHAASQMPEGAGAVALEIALAQPATFTVDAQGKVTGIVDEAAYWRRVRASLQSSKAPADTLAPASKFLDKVRAMPGQQRALIASKSYRSMLRGVGTHRSVKSVEGDVVLTSMDVTQSPDTVTIVWSADMRAAFAKWIEDMRAVGTPNNGSAEPNLTYEATEKIIVDRTTGLLIRSELAEIRVRAGRPIRSVKITSQSPENS